MSEAKRWPNCPHWEIQLTDNYQNVIVFRPITKALNARFTHGENLLVDLPKYYRSYDIQLANESIITTADLDAIAQWKLAITIKIVDANGVSLGLVERANAL